MYLYSFLLRATLRSDKRQIISTSSQFLFPYFPFPFHFLFLHFILFALPFLFFILLLLYCFGTHIHFHSILLFIFFPMARQVLIGQGLFVVNASRSQTQHTSQDSSGRAISSSQRTLPDNTRRLNERDMPSPSGIRTYNHSRRAAVDPCLKPHSHRERPSTLNYIKYMNYFPASSSNFLNLRWSSFKLSPFCC